jgi:hypothetical protein
MSVYVVDVGLRALSAAWGVAGYVSPLPYVSTNFWMGMTNTLLICGILGGFFTVVNLITTTITCGRLSVASFGRVMLAIYSTSRAALLVVGGDQNEPISVQFALCLAVLHALHRNNVPWYIWCVVVVVYRALRWFFAHVVLGSGSRGTFGSIFKFDNADAEAEASAAPAPVPSTPVHDTPAPSATKRHRRKHRT